MRSVPVGLRPSFFLGGQRFRTRQTLRHHQTLESREPAMVVPRTIHRFTARRVELQLIGKRRRPFIPRELPLLRQLDGERKRLSLPWLRKHWPTRIAWQSRQRRNIVSLER